MGLSDLFFYNIGKGSNNPNGNLRCFLPLGFAPLRHGLDNSCLGIRKLFNVLLSRIDREASLPMRDIELFSSKQMYFHGREKNSLILS